MKIKQIKKYITGSREPFFDVVLDYINENSKILDIGSGDGSFAKRIKRNDVYMFDGNEDTIANLKKEFKNITYGKLPNLPYENASFDLIHSSHLVEHLQPQELYDLLKEMDRCLKPNGYIVISAPMLWSEFYDDMSHLKPYYPKLFYKYLCWGQECCCTRRLISNKYKKIKEIYRYNKLPYDNMEVCLYSDFINNLLLTFKKLKQKLGFYKLEKSGYTIVLQKGNVKYIEGDPQVSVVIPTYNREKTINYCLDSVLNQTYKNLEVIIVDDCSTDKTVEIVKGYKDERIKLIELDKNSGAQKARNEGIKAATSEWITFLDSDDEWLSDKIEKQVAIMRKESWNEHLVIHSNAILNDTLNGVERIYPMAKVDGDNVYPIMLRLSTPMFQAIFTSKKALEEVGYLDEDCPSYQEWDTSIKLAKICKFIHMEEPTFKYYYHEGDTISKNKKNDVKGHNYIINKYKEDILKYCGEDVWYNHIMEQYQMSVKYGLEKEAKEAKRMVPLSYRLKKFLYKKEKDGNRRKVTFFDFIKITYRKSKH